MVGITKEEISKGVGISKANKVGGDSKDKEDGINKVLSKDGDNKVSKEDGVNNSKVEIGISNSKEDGDKIHGLHNSLNGTLEIGTLLNLTNLTLVGTILIIFKFARFHSILIAEDATEVVK